MQIRNCGTNFLHSFSLKVLLIDQVHHHFHHDILFLGLTLTSSSSFSRGIVQTSLTLLLFVRRFSNHQSESDEGIVREPLGAVRTIEDAVVVEKPMEQRE